MGRSELVLATLVAASLAASLAAPSLLAPRDHAAAPLPAHPTRVVSLSLPADELALALLDRDRIAALSPYAADPLASNVAAEARAMRRVAPRAESILARRPDLVIAPFYLGTETLALVRQAGVAVCPIGHATSFAEVRAEIRSLGACVHEPERAERVVRGMDAELARVEARLGSSSQPTVLLYDASGTTAARGTLFDEIIRRAGGRNAAASLGLSGHAPLPLASLLRLDPDFIIAHRYVADSRERPLVPSAAFTGDPRFATLRAVRAGHVLHLPSPLVTSTSHYAAGTVLALARALHPEAFR